MHNQSKVTPKVDILTGLRPTNNLTIANYLGAVRPIIEMQNSGQSIFLFVADLHALTDKEPSIAKMYSRDIVLDYIALGVDPQKVTIYNQSDIAAEVSQLTLFLMRHITVAELMRVPTLKDKIKAGLGQETANSLLANYPVMMAADILIQKAKAVPVGKDQAPHLEVARELARRFNKQYGEVLFIPENLDVQQINILGLKGPQKMSKSIPEQAIFLTDTADVVANKIKKAETANAGEMSPSLESHITVVRMLANESQLSELESIINEHLNGGEVMGRFKQLMTEVTTTFLTNFQNNRKEIEGRADYIEDILLEGAEKARSQASSTLQEAKKAMVA